MDDNVKDEDPISHGARSRNCCGKRLSTFSQMGEIIRGVAPEAQLMFLRVFSDTKGGPSSKFHLH